ncbi:hypothetical protein BDN70DRAFT_396329 [Pholiota conissans]|uniref:Uncharacterized protein n=1 Tax=Pholiota conissans TaxID=109636 RepID=A0A9P5YRC5_9AGAR|nr:hypothetical protein BDN70DRAFT_396329 [Pholiota conissans]
MNFYSVVTSRRLSKHDVHCSALTHGIPGGCRTENLCFSIIDECTVDFLLDFTWLMGRDNVSCECYCLTFAHTALASSVLSPQMTQASNCTNNKIKNLNYDIFITIEKFSMSESTINCTVRIRRGNQEGCSSDHTMGHAICGQGLLTFLQSFLGA